VHGHHVFLARSDALAAEIPLWQLASTCCPAQIPRFCNATRPFGRVVVWGFRKSYEDG
jgi:hypothetical protein